MIHFSFTPHPSASWTAKNVVHFCTAVWTLQLQHLQFLNAFWEFNTELGHARNTFSSKKLLDPYSAKPFLCIFPKEYSVNSQERILSCAHYRRLLTFFSSRKAVCQASGIKLFSFTKTTVTILKAIEPPISPAASCAPGAQAHAPALEAAAKGKNVKKLKCNQGTVLVIRKPR